MSSSMLETAKGSIMDKIETMIRGAHTRALEICKLYAQGTVAIADEDKLIIDKYIGLGAIQFVKSKVNKTQGIYYPCLQGEEFAGLTKNTWLKIVRHAMDIYHIDSGLSINSVATYTTSAWRYGIEPVKLLTPTDLGGTYSAMYKEECDTWEMVKKEYDENN